MFKYLNNLIVNRDLLKKQVYSIPEESWHFHHYWSNSKKKTVTDLEQVYLNDSGLDINYILSQISIKSEHVVFFRYAPFGKLKPHIDWVTTTAILIGISDHSDIIFWKDNNKNIVSYTAPILADLQSMHSVENNTGGFRYILKIPFRESYNTMLQHVENLF